MSHAALLINIGAGLVLLAVGAGMIAAARRARRRGGETRFGERDATALLIIGGFFAVLALFVLAGSAFVEEERAAPPAAAAPSDAEEEPAEAASPSRIAALVRESIAPFLREHFQGPIDRFITSLPPWSGTAAAVALFALGGLWVLFLKRPYVYLGAPDTARWRDLRLWAVLSLIPYILLYLVFM